MWRFPRPGPPRRPRDPLVDTGVSMAGVAKDGMVVRLGRGSSTSIASPCSPFQVPFPPNGDNAARLSAKLARPIGSRGARSNGLASSSPPAASQGVEVANGAGVARSSLARNSSRGMVLVLGGGDGAESPLAAPRVASADQIDGVGARLALRGRRCGGVGGASDLAAGRTFGMAPVAAAVAAVAGPDGEVVGRGASMPAGGKSDLPAGSGPGAAKADGRPSSRRRVHRLQHIKNKNIH